MNWDIDFDEEEAGAPAAAPPAAPPDLADDDDIWDDEDRLDELPDPEAEAAQKKREEEEAEAERLRREEEKQQRKEKKKANAEARSAKPAPRPFDDDDGDDDEADPGGLERQRLEIRSAMEALGTIDKVDASQIDIGRSVPVTPGDFIALKEAIVAKVATFPASVDRVEVVKELVKTLADGYSAKQMRELSQFVANILNARLPKKTKTGKGGQFLHVEDASCQRQHTEVGFDDFM